MSNMFSLIPEEGVSLPSPGPEGTVPTIISSCYDINQVEAMDTRMTVPCEDASNCTIVNSQPGATIVSPLVLSLLGVTGQITALVFLSRSTRPQHSRTVFFLLLCNLIWTDLVGKILTTPPAIFTYVHGRWMGGVHLCNYHGFVMMIIGMFTHLLVCAMAVERFLGIRHGYYYSTNITTTRTKMLLLSLWLFVVLFCAMPLFGVGKYALQYPGSWCYIDLHPCGDTPLIHRIYTNVYGLLNAISVVILVGCNFVVIGTLLRMRLGHNSSLSATASCQPHRSRKIRELELQTVIVLAVITIVFVASWAPLDLRLFLNQVWPHNKRDDHISDLVAIRLASVNQILDPWVYIICRKLFTSRMWRFMRRLVLSKTWSSLHQSQQQKSPVLAAATAAPNSKKPKKTSTSDTSGGVRSGGGGVAVGHLIPIPVFMCEQYRLEASSSSSIRHNRRLRRRIHSSASSPGTRRRTRKQPGGRLPGGTVSMEHYRDESSRALAQGLSRSNSWCCSKDTSTYKGFRSQSTQTIEDDEENVEEEKEEKVCEQEVPTCTITPSTCEVVDESSEESVFVSLPEESPAKKTPLCLKKSVGTKERLKAFPPILPFLMKTGRGHHHRQSADGKKYSIIADTDACVEEEVKSRKRHPKLAEIPFCRAKESSDIFVTTTSCPPLCSASDKDSKGAKTSVLKRVLSRDSVSTRTASDTTSSALSNGTGDPSENPSDSEDHYKSASGLDKRLGSSHTSWYSDAIDPQCGNNHLDSRVTSSNVKETNLANKTTSVGSVVAEIGTENLSSGVDRNYQRLGTTKIGSASIGLVSAEKSSGGTDLGNPTPGLDNNIQSEVQSARMKWPNLNCDGGITPTHCARQSSEPTRSICKQTSEVSGMNYRQTSEPTRTKWKRNSPPTTMARAEESEEETDDFCSAYDSFV